MSEKKPPNSAKWSDAFLQDTSYVFRRGHHFRWNGQCYDRIADMQMQRTVSEFLRKIDPNAATGHMVKSVVETIAQRTAIDDEPPEPLNLDGQPAKNVIAFCNGLFFVDDYVKEKLNELSASIPI